MAWLSPAFPVGAFGWSHGIEAAVADGRIADGRQALAWIETLLEAGSGWNDLVLLAAAWRAVRDGDAAKLDAISELGVALAGSFERRAETTELGEAFAAAARPWSGGEEDAVLVPYPVAVGQLCAANGVPLEPALAAFAHAFAANILSAAVRLVPLGQREATRILHALEPAVLRAAGRAGGSSLDDLGSAALWSDIAPMRHETLATRLFRS